MQSLHKKNKASFSKGWISPVKIEENKRKRAVIPTCFHLFIILIVNPYFSIVKIFDVLDVFVKEMKPIIKDFV